MAGDGDGSGTVAASGSAVRPMASSSGPKTTASLDRPSTHDESRSGVVQPKPQALAKRSGPSSIIVSPRQKGNPVLDNIKAMPWEYGDIPADYVLGLTTCALFLSLKYHRLHPEYIYTRMRNLQGKYQLRIILVMVDIPNHEECLKELSKTSLINNVTLILCWSAAEGGRYLELFKTYENATPTSIKQHQSTSYSDRMVDFITTPRSINKADAVSLVSQFGTIRTAVNARHEDVAQIAGWGEKKVQRWCAAVREPFRIQTAAKRGMAQDMIVQSQPVSRAPNLSKDRSRENRDSPAPRSGLGASPLRESITSSRPVTPAIDTEADQRPRSRLAEEIQADETLMDDEAAMAEALQIASEPKAVDRRPSPARKRNQNDDPLSEGVMAALSKLRDKNG